MTGAPLCTTSKSRCCCLLFVVVVVVVVVDVVVVVVVVVGKDHGVGWYCSSSTGEEVLTVYRPSTRIHGHCQA